MNLTCKVVGATEFAAKLDAMPSKIHARIRRAVEGAGIGVQRGVKNSRLKGQVLNVRTGRLRDHITQQTTDDGKSITSRVGTDVEYGAYWELGFDRKLGYGARGGMRSFRGKPATFAKRIQKLMSKSPPRIKHEQRPFLGPELEDQRDVILDKIRTAVYGKEK